MKVLEKKLLGCPIYGYLTGILLYLLQNQLYEGIRFYQEGSGIIWHDTKIPVLDDMIPLVPAFWVIVYLLSHIFWIVLPVIASRGDKKHYKNFVIGIVLAELVGAAIFLLYPTGMDRMAEGLLVHQSGFSNEILQWIYAHDGNRYASNLFPSFHCLISTSCFLAVYRQEKISRLCQWTTFVICILIFISTVTTKQHYVIDIPAGIALALLGDWIAQHWDLGARIDLFFASLRKG